MKIIHFISLKNSYSLKTLGEEPSHWIFTRLTDLLPNLNRYFVGPFFTSTEEATAIAYEGFKLVLNKELVGVNLAAGAFDLRLGTEGILKKIVSSEFLDDLDEYSSWKQVSSLIKDGGEYLGAAKMAIKSLFNKLQSGDECLIFTVFPFGEIICQEFLEESKDIPIFSFLEGFSLIDNGSVLKAELLQ